ncbi:MAG: hypothetical protein RLY67_1076 [Pseudomonadota bacterium]
MPKAAAVDTPSHGQVVDFISGWPNPVRAAISRRFPAGIQAGAEPLLMNSPEPAFAHGFNLGAHVGDAVGRVVEHRSFYARAIRSRPVWLNQVHEKAVLNLDHLTDEEIVGLDQSIQSDHARQRATADACFTTQPGRACTIMFADCLAVLLAHSSGQIVGAAHAGWRGLAGGVLGALLEEMKTNCPSGSVGNQWLAWLGPCIGPAYFEVGPEVVEAMVSAGLPARTTPGRGDRVYLNLQDLAFEALHQAARRLEVGVEVLGRDPRCTYSDEVACFSHRRDGRSGRMAASIWVSDEAK